MSTAGRREVWERTNQCYMALHFNIRLLTPFSVFHLQVVHWLHHQCLCFGSSGICDYSLYPHHVLYRQRQFEVLDRYKYTVHHLKLYF